jgi:adenylosuccinate lyase
VTARLAESAMYGHLWGTTAVRAVLDERGRLQGWLDVLTALMRAQAAHGLVPQAAVERLATVTVDDLDLDAIAAQTRATGHSTLGLVRALSEVLPPEVHRHVYVGATVQDLTDTWTATVLRTVLAQVRRDLRRVEGLALDLAVRHRDDLQAGRTHGQPGAPVTFGWKAATWADEVRRSLDRLREGSPRWLVGQLGGGVGTLAAQGDEALAVRARFCAELGLADPGISWLTARDRVAEVGGALSLACATLARIGNEVYELQRPEVGELREPVDAEVVASITMPHKRNPERSEHLVTLSRLVRASAGVLVEGMVGAHERDGRSWKAEWIALPEVLLLTATACSLAAELLADLEVDTARMRANLLGLAASEQALSVLTGRLGKPRAQAALQAAFATSGSAEQALSSLLTPEELAGLSPDAGHAAAMVDLVVARLRAAGTAEDGA